jgi:4-hydroxyphenylpyruvate dioxygenase
VHRDDLAARFALREAQVARMREFGMPYERAGGGESGGGEYFHACSEPFAERFFFEMVQRMGGYDGYGALDAPARMASQLQPPASRRRHSTTNSISPETQ